MTFNFRLFFRLAYRTFFDNAGTTGRLTWKRFRAMSLWFTFMPIHHLTTWFCFWLDDIFFPAYKNQEITEPIFIIGNFRSGSTMLQRLLSDDTDNFTAMKLWEIYAAPSITQRHIYHWAKKVDAKLLGGFFFKIMWDFNQKNLDVIPMHKVNLWAVDEDEGLLIHNYASTFLIFVFPFLDEIPAYYRFDADVSDEEKRTSMEFYRECVRRHVYYHGGKQYIAKNPTFSVKIEALADYFPGAKFIYLARNPMEQIPSQTSFLSYVWSYFNDPEEQYPLRDFVLELIKYWYQYPLEALDKLPNRNRVILRYDDLVNNLDDSVSGIYERFDLKMSPRFQDKVDVATERSRNFKSKHSYSLEEMGYSEKQTYRDFREIFQRFKFRRTRPFIMRRNKHKKNQQAPNTPSA